MDFFTTEVLTLKGLTTYYICAVLHSLGDSPSETGRIHAVPGSGVDGAAGAKHDDGGVGKPERLPLSTARPRCEVLPIMELIKTGSVNPLRLPARSPNLNSYAERWVRSVKEECLSRLILFGEWSLRRALQQYMEHYHGERNHQSKDNRILFPSPEARGNTGDVRCREGLGGLLKYYERESA
jgi:putative transposase